MVILLKREWLFTIFKHMEFSHMEFSRKLQFPSFSGKKNEKNKNFNFLKSTQKRVLFPFLVQKIENFPKL